MEGLESSVCIFCLFQSSERCAVCLLHSGRIDGSEQLTLADSISLIHTDGSDVACDFETECRTHLYLNGSHIILRALQVGISHGERFYLYGFLFCLLGFFRASRQHQTADDECDEPSHQTLYLFHLDNFFSSCKDNAFLLKHGKIRFKKNKKAICSFSNRHFCFHLF